MKRYKAFGFIAAIMCGLFITGPSLANHPATGSSSQLLRVDPIPGAEWVPVSSGMTLQFDSPVQSFSLQLVLKGIKGGTYPVSLEATSDPAVLVARPGRPLEMDDSLTATLTGPGGFQEEWHFSTVPLELPASTFEWIDLNARAELGRCLPMTHREPSVKDDLDETDTVELPLTLPEITIENPGGAADGLIFLQAFDNGGSDEVQANFVLNNAGDVVYYRYFNDRIPFDWQPHDNVGKASYFSYLDHHFHILDTTWTQVDLLTTANGYRADPHDLKLLEDGSYYVLGYDVRIMDLSEVVEGGDEEAVVTGAVVQHIDEFGDVLFEWRSLDHYALTDVDTNKVDLTDNQIDACHANSIDFDLDGNLVISSRNLSEITKIDRETGAIIWRFSGVANQFTFLGDEPYPGCGIQHDARILENGHLMMFNNGAHQSDYVSSAKEYELNTEAMTAELVWSFQNEQETISWAMGSARRQPNGNTLIGWGTARAYDPVNPIATEVDADGNVVWRAWYNGGVNDDLISYRAYRSSMNFCAAHPYVAAAWDGSDVRVSLNYFGHDDIVSYRTVYRTSGGSNTTEVHSEGPTLTIQGLETFEEYVIYAFAVDSLGQESIRSNYFTLHQNLNDLPGNKPAGQPSTMTIQKVSPNPFNASTTVTLNITQPSLVHVSLYNILGQKIAVLRDGPLAPGQHRMAVRGESLASGMYFIRAESANGMVQTRKIVCVQ